MKLGNGFKCSLFKDLIEFHPAMQRNPFEEHNFSIMLGEQVFYPNRDHKELKHIRIMDYGLLDDDVVKLAKIMVAGKFRNLQRLYCVSCVSHAWQIRVRLLQKLCILIFSVLIARRSSAATS